MLDDGGGESAQYMENETHVCLLMCAVWSVYMKNASILYLVKM
jgi:hypothetical protein